MKEQRIRRNITLSPKANEILGKFSNASQKIDGWIIAEQEAIDKITTSAPRKKETNYIRCRRCFKPFLWLGSNASFHALGNKDAIGTIFTCISCLKRDVEAGYLTEECVEAIIQERRAI